MAFSHTTSRLAVQLQPRDNLLLYTTRDCFGNPARKRGRIVGHATVDSPVVHLDDPVTFGERIFRVGCWLKLHLLAALGQGIELQAYVPRLHAFPNADAWSAYLRRTLVFLDDHDYDMLMTPLRAVAFQPSEAVAEYIALGASLQHHRARKRSG